MTEEWQHVARAMAAHDVVDPGGSEHWADHMFGARAKQFIAAFDAITEYRAQTGPSVPDIERAARRMAREQARHRGVRADLICGEVDDTWHQFRAIAVENLTALRSGNA